ncbi:MAG: hypothetical protein GXO98_01935 [Nitrospirae bacterium]|nr:hypothetical protein [Nitrospirota bacterium]
MGFLKRLFPKKGKGASGQESKDILWLHIQCSKCGKTLKLCVNKNTDLENLYKERGESGPAYVLRKEAMDDKCFTKIFIRVEFDENRNVLSREITNGEFIQPQKSV